MRTAIFVVLLFAPYAFAQERAPTSRRVVEPETRRSADEIAAAERRASAKQRAKWRFDQEMAKVSKPEPEPPTPKYDPKATKTDRDRVIAEWVKARDARREREKARKARLADLTALAATGGIPEDCDVDEALRRRKENAAAAHAAEEAKEKAKQDAEFKQVLDAFGKAAKEHADRNSKVELKVGQHRTVSIAWVTTFPTMGRVSELIELDRANDEQGMGEYARKYGTKRPTGSEFIIIELYDAGIAKVRLTDGPDLFYVEARDLRKFAAAVEAPGK